VQNNSVLSASAVYYTVAVIRNLGHNS